MGICIEAYRTTIGLFHNCVKHCKKIVYPKEKFYHNYNHNFMYKLHEWSNYLVNTNMNRNALKSQLNIHCILALSLIMQMLIICAYDVHLNSEPNTKYYDLRVCHANIRSVSSSNKLTFIKTELAGKYDIIALSESWLCNNDRSEKLKIPGYQMPFRRDRDNGQTPYGGVMAYITDSLVCKRRKDIEPNDCELMWLEISTSNKKIYMCVAYRSEANTDIGYWEKLQSNIDHIRSLYNLMIFICGDFNADFKSRHGKHFIDFVNSNNFNYHVREPTRITPTGSTTLDQFVSNFPIFSKDVSILPPLPSCDHCVISVNIKF